MGLRERAKRAAREALSRMPDFRDWRGKHFQVLMLIRAPARVYIERASRSHVSTRFLKVIQYVILKIVETRRFWMTTVKWQIAIRVLQFPMHLSCRLFVSTTDFQFARTHIGAPCIFKVMCFPRNI